MDVEGVNFGPFRFDVRQRVLSRGGKPVKLRSRALDILSELVAAHGEVVSKDTLLERVWPDQVVEENALHVHVSALRKALTDETSGECHVMTVTGRGYRLLGVAPARTAEVASVLAASSSRSVAVLPFQNLGSDPEQEYFADGIVEDIIAGLSRFKLLFVIARNSSFIYKGKAIDLKQVARELGVRYLLEGSVRKAADRIRINVQLIEAETGRHLWVERYDRKLDDIFAVQDEITMSVLGAIEPSIRKAEIERVKRKRPDSLDAYDLVLRAMPYASTHIAADAETAIPLLEKALALEPGYAAAHALLAWCYHFKFSRAGQREEDRGAAVSHARAAVSHGADDSTSLGMAGFVISLDEHDHATARELFDRALALSNSGSFVLCSSALTLSWWGEPEAAIERAQRALQLSPFDFLNYLAYNALAISYLQLGRFAEAHDAARRSVQINPRFSVSHAFLTAALVGMGCLEEATSQARQVVALDPTFTVRRFAVTVDIEPKVFAPMAEAWRRAGLPEG
jgi:TolB-like protein/Flp pilus assembly protein TadD